MFRPPLSRLPRLSGPPSLQMSMPVPVIKVERDHPFEMTPSMPPDFAIDFSDTSKHFGAMEANIKVEPDIVDFDQGDFDSLENLISNYEMNQAAVVHVERQRPTIFNMASQNCNLNLPADCHQEDVKPDINKNEPDFARSATTSIPSIPSPICLQVNTAHSDPHAVISESLLQGNTTCCTPAHSIA